MSTTVPFENHPEPLLALVEAAMVETLAGEHKFLLEALVAAARAIDETSREAQREAISAAVYITRALREHREMSLDDTLGSDAVEVLARHLAQLESRPAKRSRTAAEKLGEAEAGKAARGGLASVLRMYIERGGLVAKVAACGTIIIIARWHALLAARVGTLLSVEIVRLASEPSKSELVPIVAVAALSSLVAADAETTELRRAVVDAGALRALVDAIRHAVLGARTEGGDASPTALLLPQHATAAICALSADDKAIRQKAVDTGAVTACLALISAEIDPRCATCRIAQQEALRFVTLTAVVDQNVHSNLISEEHAAGVIRLITAPEASVRKSAARSLLYIMRANLGAITTTVLKRADFLRGLVCMLDHYATKGEVLRLALLMAQLPAVAVNMVKLGFSSHLGFEFADRRNSSACRAVALRALFALGEFELITSGRALEACRGESLEREVCVLQSLVEDRRMQLACASRPAIEEMYAKTELLEYLALFNEVCTQNDQGEKAVRTQKRMLSLLKKCCDRTNDKITKKKLNRGTVRKICETYDTDKSGFIEWGEFLHIMKDLREGGLVDALYL